MKGYLSLKQIKIIFYGKWESEFNLNSLKQPDISERLVNTIREKLENIDLNSVKNEYLISFINSATEETIPMQEKLAMAWWYYNKRIT